MPAIYLMIGGGVLALVVVVLILLGRVRRFSRAAERLRGGLARGTGALPALRSRHR